MPVSAAAPPDSQDEAYRPDFEIGLALAGAISAGAYTAGVIDFLFQALHEWEKAKSRGAPVHQVTIRTVAGASAGAITGALGIVALTRGLRPVALSDQERAVAQGTIVPPNARDGQYQRIRCVLPTLYDTWVVRPRMVAAKSSKDMDLLGTEDLKDDDGNKSPISSLLNSKLLDQIEAVALKCPELPLPVEPQEEHLIHAPGPFPFLSETMHVFMTVTNLRGIPFNVAFGEATYGMLSHGDRLHYRIENVGTELANGRPWGENGFLTGDRFITLNAQSLPSASKAEVPKEWKSYGSSAIASAAFPGGLAPRLITTSFDQYVKRQYPLPVEYGTVQANFPSSCNLSGDFEYLSLDGGIVNNTPFDFVEYSLWSRGEKRKTGPDADRAVIMVAPFPEPPTFLAEGQPKRELGAVVKALLPTLINQARFRSSELGAALNKDDRSRFLISPMRSLANGPMERYAIACGLLGGFGGFLDERFRSHDFQLGRRNCQHFLASIFKLPPSNEALQAGDSDRQVPATERQDIYRSSGEEFMIIPLIGEAKREVGLPPWPKMSGDDFRTLMTRIAKRFDAIRDPVIEAQIAGPELRQGAKLLVRLGKPRLLRIIELTILADLVRRNQIEGWDLPANVRALTDQTKIGRKIEDVQTILASLVSATRPSATAAEIAAAAHLDAGFVTAVLDALGTLPESAPHRALKVGTVKVGKVEAGAAGASEKKTCNRPSEGTATGGPAMERTGTNLSRAVEDAPRKREADVYKLQMHVPVGKRAWPVVGGWIERFFPQSYRYG